MAGEQADQPATDKTKTPAQDIREIALPQPYRDAFARYDEAVRAIISKGVAERKALGLEGVKRTV
jgi:hypothetical protein